MYLEFSFKARISKSFRCGVKPQFSQVNQEICKYYSFIPKPAIVQETGMAVVVSRLGRSRLTLGIILAGGGSAIALIRLRKLLRGLHSEQKDLAAAVLRPGSSLKPVKSVPKVSVDKVFLARLRKILAVCVPGTFTKEFALILVQGLLLVSRTLLTDKISALEGDCAAATTSLNWKRFRQILKTCALIFVPASIVNSSLKAVQVLISLSFRKRLTEYVHLSYMRNRAYYSASVLGGLQHADQRITDDVEKFCDTITDLYSYTFKPILDIAVFSRSLSHIIGYKGQLILYGYFFLMSNLLRQLSPPLAAMTAQWSALSGDFRSAHSRLSAHAEEVAFNDPPGGHAELRVLNARLGRMLRHSTLTAWQRFVQQCLDGYFLKYTSSCIGLVIFALPLYGMSSDQQVSGTQLAGRYINAMKLMMSTSSALAQLVLVYKRVNTLAGHTSRVSELLEQVRELGESRGQLRQFDRMQARVRSANPRLSTSIRPKSPRTAARNSHMVAGDAIKFEDVSLWSPDGTPLVTGLNCTISKGTSVIITGPNGSGKSSLLRMLAELWPLQSGVVTRPPRHEIFYLSQRPYMYSGCLREQLQYPNLPGVVHGEQVSFDPEFARKCLTSVELDGLIERCYGFEGRIPWDETLSGGERNRLAVARLLYHKPSYAVLDECTAAVSADGEVTLYEAMQRAGITMLSVAHREKVQKFHQAAVAFDGEGGWSWKDLVHDESASGMNGVREFETS